MSEIKWSPVKMKFLLWCYTNPGPYERLNAEYVELFTANDLIEPGDEQGVYSTTARGSMLIRHWMETPLPVRVWVRGENEN